MDLSLKLSETGKGHSRLRLKEVKRSESFLSESRSLASMPESCGEITVNLSDLERTCSSLN